MMIKKIISALALFVVYPLVASGKEFGSVLVLDQMPERGKVVSFNEDIDIAPLQLANDERSPSVQSSHQEEAKDDSKNASLEDFVVIKMFEEQLKQKEAHGTKTPSVKDSKSDLQDHEVNTPSPCKTKRLAGILSVGSVSSLYEHATDTPSPKHKKFGRDASFPRIASTGFGSFRSIQGLGDHVTHTPSDRDGSSQRRLLFPSGSSAAELADFDQAVSQTAEKEAQKLQQKQSTAR